MTIQKHPSGLWLPLITPFKDNELDQNSLRRLLSFYCAKGLSGIILAATTGESQTISDAELQRLIACSQEQLDKLGSNIPIYVGVSGSDPVKVSSYLKKVSAWKPDGYLVSGPNYLRPSQEGVRQYFEAAALSTARPVILYNIPYRTGVNLLNETLFELAEIPNVIGVKDCCGNPAQSHELIRNAPNGFSVMTGEDPFFYNSLVHGGPGAIVTGAHILVDAHLQIYADLASGDYKSALRTWNSICGIPPVLFAEPSPAPVKYWLWKKGLIDSPEVRSPILRISSELAGKIDKIATTFP